MYIVISISNRQGFEQYDLFNKKRDFTSLFIRVSQKRMKVQQEKIVFYAIIRFNLDIVVLNSIKNVFDLQ